MYLATTTFSPLGICSGWKRKERFRALCSMVLGWLFECAIFFYFLSLTVFLIQILLSPTVRTMYILVSLTVSTT